MSSAHLSSPPCPHGVGDRICWRCTRVNIGTLAAVREWLRIAVARRALEVKERILWRLLGRERYVERLARRLSK